MIDDMKPRKAVLAELNCYPRVPAGQIGVPPGGGVVTLIGLASGYALARVGGVRAMVEELRVNSGQRCKRGDEAFSDRIVEQFSWDTTISKYIPIAQVEDGWLSRPRRARSFEKEAAATAIHALEAAVGAIKHVTAIDAGTMRLTGSVDTFHNRKDAEETQRARPGAVRVKNLLETV